MEARGKPRFAYELCVACAICMHACAFGSIEMSHTGLDRLNKAYPALDRPDTCTGCALCEQECPVGAITLRA